MVNAATTVATGVALTLGVPFVALHELIKQRHKQNMKRHLPKMIKKVNFECERAPKQAPPPLPLTSSEEKALDLALTVPLPLPPAKSTLRRQASPPPTYEDIFAETKAARVERPAVRFAQMA